MASRMESTVKWFNNKRGFGFIHNPAGQDIFIHHKGILGSGYKTLAENERVSFELITTDKGPRAENVERLGGQYRQAV